LKINILINALGIQDSGGITVFNKMLEECSLDTKYKYHIFVYKNQNIINLLSKFQSYDSFTFIMIENLGILHRLYYENILFRSFIKTHNINLVYNFSGSNQYFIKTPTLVKVHNLLFYSKKLDKAYKRMYNIKLWFKQVWLKRAIFLSMLKKSHNIEIQSTHVKDILSDFIKIKDKRFFLKNDFSVLLDNFKESKKYNFNKQLTFLYIVGPHFEYPHKNMQDFIGTMKYLKSIGKDLKIDITLSFDELNNSKIWDSSLNDQTNFLGYLKDKKEIQELFQDNTILVSTSIIETIGLHIVEGIQNGVLCIVPDEQYSKSVYGSDLLKYELFNSKSLTNVIMEIYDMPENEIQEIILKTQEYIINNEASKFHTIVDVFNKILEKEKNV